MRILVTGAYGLIGAACLARLFRDGHALVGAGRAVGEARRRLPFAQWVEADFARLVTAAAWRPLLSNIDAVVNCVGVLQDGARDDTRRVHVEATSALFDACQQAGIRRVIHVSAIGAERDGPTGFSRTKAAAEAHLASLDLDWVILRPGLVLAPAVHGGTAMVRALAAAPLVMPLVGAASRIQVVSIAEVVDTVALCLAPDAPAKVTSAKVTWELVHPQVLSLREVVSAVRGWLGFPPRPVVAPPQAVAVLVSAVADVLGWLGWRSPARSTALAQLAAGVIGDPAPWIAATGIKPKSLRDILAATPANVQDRWFAKLYLIKPVAIGALALFWIATGAFALGPGRASALSHLAEAGFAPAFAKFVLVAGSMFDIVLGTLLLVRKLARSVLITMLAVTPGYLLVGTLGAPQLWFDPLGPYTKVIPMLIATMFTLAILDER
jgi:uncharacterized protein YbjT (DUF2867 family)